VAKKGDDERERAVERLLSVWRGEFLAGGIVGGLAYAVGLAFT